MSERETVEPIRLWPGWVIVALQMQAWFVVLVAFPEAPPIGFFGGVVGWLAIVVWWGFFSRAPRSERWRAVVLMIVALAATYLVLHDSIAKAMMGLIYILHVTLVLSPAFVAWATASRGLSERPRRITMAAMVFLACGVMALLRSEGMTGGDGAVFAWRWSETAEERLLALADDGGGETAAVGMRTGADWPGFRGSERDGRVSGTRIATDWSVTAPSELWRRPIGPGWSSFAVRGDLIFTQEQRGGEELVVCHRLETGERVWANSDRTRFWEAIGGPGPRATPTLDGDRLYSFGATSILNAFEASNGKRLWSRNVSNDTGEDVPMWGFSSSPLTVDDRVFVAAAGTLVAYDAGAGDLLWTVEGGWGYSSPHSATMLRKCC
ncbi:MAG: hypothetical protein CME26_04455 [Gemmatimonadetes bacterium]|nr:hypothetical protein [Gemmatimonadota bacterium]|tara:strand:+ start:2203 stop:3342 length:1140 start_codon:yes stop_codon:yes gene_type:complete